LSIALISLIICNKLIIITNNYHTIYWSYRCFLLRNKIVILQYNIQYRYRTGQPTNVGLKYHHRVHAVTIIIVIIIYLIIIIIMYYTHLNPSKSSPRRSENPNCVHYNNVIILYRPQLTTNNETVHEKRLFTIVTHFL